MKKKRCLRRKKLNTLMMNYQRDKRRCKRPPRKNTTNPLLLTSEQGHRLLLHCPKFYLHPYQRVGHQFQMSDALFHHHHAMYYPQLPTQMLPHDRLFPSQGNQLRSSQAHRLMGAKERLIM